MAETKTEQAAVETTQAPPVQTQIPHKNPQGGRSDLDINMAIKSLQEETQQIFELIEMERTYGAEVSNQLKQIIMPLNLSYHIKPESISKTDSSISDVVLTPQGMVCVFNNAGSMISRPLESFQSDVLIRILLEVIPEIKVMLNEKRQKMSGRVMTLERVAKELRKVPALVPTKTTVSGKSSSNSSNDQSSSDGSRDKGSSSGSSQDAMKSVLDKQ
ncbi:MAG TPA: hypothetical protein VED17_10195 [Nitrososphaerales archaeon]|nr:hypothetical protein [Nitrososphaerales archaeon]